MPLLRRPPGGAQEDGDPFAANPESRRRRRATLGGLVGLGGQLGQLGDSSGDTWDSSGHPSAAPAAPTGPRRAPRPPPLRGLGGPAESPGGGGRGQAGVAAAPGAGDVGQRGTEKVSPVEGQAGDGAEGAGPRPESGRRDEDGDRDREPLSGWWATLGVVRSHVAPAYPPEYGALGVYARGYHRALAQQLRALAQRPLAVPELYLLLDWHSNAYPRWPCPHTAGGRVPTITVAMSPHAGGRCPHPDDGGRVPTLMVAVSPQLLRAHVDRAPQVTPEFGREMAHSLLGVLVAFLHRCDSLGTAWGQLGDTPYFGKLMKRKWLTSSDAFDAIVMRVTGFAQTLRPLHPEPHQDSAWPWLDSVVPRLRELLVLEDTAALQMEVGGPGQGLPGRAEETLAALLDARGLRAQGPRREILGVLQDLEGSEAEPGPPRHRTFFSELPAPRPVRCLPFHLPRLRLPRRSPARTPP
ncbi:hypothetical protein DUI87_00008 [Hirundo rustica rustica]|uniref:Uncharacterized protein n=1 Tax=Hirundo rustica rustica TaxID=333673 RepID=A0A3M0LCR8_HIRRU|nr:hypothetical protein DUI87_00008 [Hirundo rustica rustica]